MASSRIRYIKDGSEGLKSLRLFELPNGQQVSVMLNTVAKQFKIVDATSGVELATGGGTKNLSVLKIKAKQSLSGLGIVFEDEKRERGATEA